MENQLFNERHSLTGTSGLLSLTNLGRTKLQPVRVKELLEMLGSDEEESEEKGKDSDIDSDSDDIQPIPDDYEESRDTQNSPIQESNDRRDNHKIISPLYNANRQIVSQKFEEKINLPENPPPKPTIKEKTHISSSENLHFTSNFVFDDESHNKLEYHKSESLPSDSALSSYFGGSSAAKSSIESNDGSNANFKPLDIPHTSTNKTSYELISSKSENIMQTVYSTVKPKFEAQESNFFSNDRHLLDTNVAQQSEAFTTSSNVQNSNYPTTDTPHKNNPPIGSMRPTPSSSHRSMFQTPQSPKFHHQDYSKNHVQTPATIFGNWSKRHMSQTPMQNSSKSQVPQNIVTATAGSTNETPWYQNTEEKNIRKPLGETMHCSLNKNRHSYTEKRYNTENTVHSSSNYHENRAPENSHTLENIKEQSSNKSAYQQHESKENRHPARLIDKVTTKEEEQEKKENIECTKESKGLSSSENVPNENRAELARRHRVESPDAVTLRKAQTRYSAPLKNKACETVVEKNVAPKQQANVQLSIPSHIRRANFGETIMVKGKEYLILGGLGQGMSCHVLRVQDLTNLELRAIKVVNLSLMEKENAQGCIQEISMLHKLQAPCVVRMFDYEIKFPMVHVVMEMGDTDFKSLLNSTTENKRLPLTMILHYWTEMLTAVKHIHENGVIHSDLKPANFLSVRGRLKLIDFGIASSINADMTSVVKNTTTGTLNYISPEALMDIGDGGSDSPNHNVKYKITFKSDVWSLGCILYSLVYRYTPFNNFRSQWAKIRAITSPTPKISFTLPAGNDVEPPPAILIDVIRQCLQHDPKARPTVTQLLQVPYITTKPNPRANLREIPSNIILKIRHSLTDDEWRQFTEILEQMRNGS